MFRTRTLVVALLLALAGLLVALGRERARVASLGRGPGRAGGKVERCVTCHTRPEEDPGGAHARAAVGCSSCHLGNPLAFDKARAHAGMESEPGALRTVALTCGRSGCHVREAQRVATSLMARASGIVSVDRFAFGEVPEPRGAATMAETLAKADPSPAETHVRKLCGGCHLHALRGNRDDAIHGNGSGCSACHVERRLPGALPRPHPSVDARVTDDRCLGCHSRSGRIALTYEGLYEVEPSQAGSCGAAATTLHDGRLACRTEADVHRLAGLSCVDCHLHTDLMGDGTAFEHEEEQVEVTCEACHGPVRGGGETAWADVKDPITRDLVRQRGEARPPAERVRLGRRGTPLWNLRPSSSGWVTLRKGQGVALATKPTPADPNHSLRGHERLACSACHAAWAPTCSTCHTRWDASGRQWDFGRGAETPGRWAETSDGYAAAPPALAVRADGKIAPSVPGMVMDLDAGATGGSPLAVRLWSSFDPHSTGKKARTCASCHVGARPTGPGTRVGLRSLNDDELGRTNAVGACLPCHARAADPVWRDFAASRARLARGGTRCALRRLPPRGP